MQSLLLATSRDPVCRFQPCRVYSKRSGPARTITQKSGSSSERSSPEQTARPQNESTSEYDPWTSFQRGKQGMEWSPLIRFVLLGSRALEPYATLLVRVALGLFFAISEGNKLLVARHSQAMYETLAAAKVPFPRLMTYLVSAVEFVGEVC
jgi:hypothetical protein